MFPISLSLGDKSRRIYGLAFDQESCAIIVSVNQGVAMSLPDFANEELVGRYRSELGLKHFEPSFKRDFGFDGALTRHQVAGAVEFRGAIHSAVSVSDKTCQFCKGTGKDRRSFDGTCFHCSGRRLEWSYDYKKAFALGVSLSILLETLRFLETEEVLARHNQLLFVQITALHGGCSIGGEYSAELVDWLEKRHRQTIEPMVVAMRRVYQAIFERISSIDRFSASVDGAGGWLNVSCPGDACGIHPSHTGRASHSCGYEFYDHNVDQPGQLLTLLAGVCALHGTAAADLDGLR